MLWVNFPGERWSQKATIKIHLSPRMERVWQCVFGAVSSLLIWYLLLFLFVGLFDITRESKRDLSNSFKKLYLTNFIPHQRNHARLTIVVVVFFQLSKNGKRLCIKFDVILLAVFLVVKRIRKMNEEKRKIVHLSFSTFFFFGKSVNAPFWLSWRFFQLESVFLEKLIFQFFHLSILINERVDRTRSEKGNGKKTEERQVNPELSTQDFPLSRFTVENNFRIK